MDCANCKYGRKLEDGLYRRSDGSSVIFNSGGNNTTCTKEIVSSIYMLDGVMTCDDFSPIESKVYNPNPEPYVSRHMVEYPLLDRISKPELIAWFRCNSCHTCLFKKEVLDKNHRTIGWCSRTHSTGNIVDMVNFLGYTMEGRMNDELRADRLEESE